MAILIDFETREERNLELETQIFLGKGGVEYLCVLSCWDSVYEYFQLLPYSRVLDKQQEFGDIAGPMANRMILMFSPFNDDSLNKYRLVNGIPESVLGEVDATTIDDKKFDYTKGWSLDEYEGFRRVFHQKYVLLEHRLRKEGRL